MVIKYKEIDEPHIPISPEKLIVGTRLPFDIFTRDGGLFRPLFDKDMLFTGAAKDLLKEKRISEIYIQQKDAFNLDYYISKNKTQRNSYYDDPAVFQEYTFYKEQYFQIDKNLLVAGKKIDFSIFMQNELSFIPIISATDTSPAVIDEKILDLTGDVLIKRSDVLRYYAYISFFLSSKDPPENEESKIKAIAVKENSKLIIKVFLDDPRSGQKVKKATTAVNKITACILENKDTIYDLLSLRNYDYYTYTHSVNVTVLSIGLGVAIGMKRNDMEKLGIGALLHDIGKSAVPSEILNRQGKLNNIEYTVIKNHVIEGEKLLRAHNDFPEESFAAVLQHHEKLTGKGYPFGLSGSDIKLFGRITAIADSYDALTTQRPYKLAVSPFSALSIVAKETGNYDPELLGVFIKMLGKIK